MYSSLMTTSSANYLPLMTISQVRSSARLDARDDWEGGDLAGCARVTGSEGAAAQQWSCAPAVLAAR